MSKVELSSGWVLLIPVGLIACLLGWLSPVHEQMHAGAVYLVGGEVTGLEWAKIWWNSPRNTWGFIRFMGYGGEVLFYGALALMFKRAGLFFFGALLPIGVMAALSIDFSMIEGGWILLLGVMWLITVVSVGRVRLRAYAPALAQDEPEPSPRIDHHARLR